LSARAQQPYKSFSTFNFCCKKEIFNKYLSEIKVDGYGHEDTLIGHVLGNNNIVVKHIDNPLIHSGLKTAEKFLTDTNSAIKNAIEIQKKYPEIEIRLIKNVNRIRKSGLAGLVRWLLSWTDKSRKENLKSNNPIISKLQIHKLYTALFAIKN